MFGQWEERNMMFADGVHEAIEAKRAEMQQEFNSNMSSLTKL